MACTKALQPGLAVLVVECDALPDLLYIGRRMKIIGVGEFPTSSFASSRPMVVLPAPTTPITITIMDEDCSRSAGMWMAPRDTDYFLE